MKLLAIVLLPAVMSTCALETPLEDKASLINFGDTRERVLEVMGSPVDRQFQENDEAWQYCQASGSMGGRYYDYRIVWFHKGLVTGIRSNKGPYSGFCVTSLRPIKWEEAPDTTVEIRTR